MYANDEPSTILTNRINRFSSQWLGLCQKRPDQLALRQTAPKRVRRNRGQIRRFRELDGMFDTQNPEVRVQGLRQCVLQH